VLHRSVIPSLLLGLVAILVAVGCSTSAGSDTATVSLVSAADAVVMLEDRTIVDVRTPEEYATGHVVGAVNIPVEADDFAERISELDPDEPYLVYCRSGRRSAIAADQMAAAGFSDIVDAGALEDLARAGAPIE